MSDRIAETDLPATAAIIGLGLIGGSLARDLHARGVRVWGYDHDIATRDTAAAAGVAPLSSLGARELGEVELVVIAVPVTVAVELLPQIAPVLGAECVVTDLGSTKRSIVRAAERVGIGDRFVGSHPLAGDHRSGWSAAREGLFAGARVYLCRTATTTDRVVDRVRGLWRSLGARPEELDSVEHDREVAWTSHLPQLASSALAAALAGAGWRVEELGPGGRDTTRLAASSPEMWSSICRDNADLIAPALASLEGQLSTFREALEKGDGETVHYLLSLAHHWARSTPTSS